jgi:predicted transport protein
MSKFGLYSNKSSTQFESHMQGLEEETKKLLLDLRNFIKNLGSNVIEEVRPHRISYAKSLTYRTFLDIKPQSDSLMISVRKSRIESDTSYTVKTIEDMANAKAKISEAYEKIK